MRAVLSGLWIVALLLALPGIASAQSAPSSVVVQSVTFSRDDGTGAPGAPVTSFNPSDHTLHAVAQLDQVLINPNLRIAWTAVAIDAGTNIPIADAAVTGLVANSIDAHLSLPTDFPTGTYRVDFYLDDQLLQSSEFQIAAA